MELLLLIVLVLVVLAVVGNRVGPFGAVRRPGRRVFDEPVYEDEPVVVEEVVEDVPVRNRRRRIVEY